MKYTDQLVISVDCSHFNSITLGAYKYTTELQLAFNIACSYLVDKLDRGSYQLYIPPSIFVRCPPSFLVYIPLSPLGKIPLSSLVHLLCLLIQDLQNLLWLLSVT